MRVIEILDVLERTSLECVFDSRVPKDALGEPLFNLVKGNVDIRLTPQTGGLQLPLVKPTSADLQAGRSQVILMNDKKRLWNRRTALNEAYKDGLKGEDAYEAVLEQHSQGDFSVVQRIEDILKSGDEATPQVYHVSRDVYNPSPTNDGGSEAEQ